MADIIPLHRSATPLRAVTEDRAVNACQEAWLLPWAMFRMGLAAWANIWFAPLGLRVENTEGRERRS
jgi:hypothetical protein